MELSLTGNTGIQETFRYSPKRFPRGKECCLKINQALDELEEGEDFRCLNFRKDLACNLHLLILSIEKDYRAVFHGQKVSKRRPISKTIREQSRWLPLSKKKMNCEDITSFSNY